MKKILAFTIALMLCMTAITPVFATVSTPEIVFDPETLLLDISGSFADSSKDYVSVFITKLGVNEITTAAINEGKVLFLSDRTDKNGNYSLSYKLSCTTPGGQYYVYITCNGESAQGNFLFFNQFLADEAVGFINQASSSNIGGVISDNLEDFGLEKAEFLAYSNYISTIVYNCKPVGGYDTDGFLKTYKTAVAVGSIKTGDSTLLGAIEANTSYIGVTADDYNALGDTIKHEVEYLFKNVDYTALSFKEAFDNYTLLAGVRTAVDAEALGNVITSNSTAMKIDLGDYVNIKNEYYQANVFVNIYNSAKNVTSFSELKTLFDKEVKVQADEYKKYLNKAPSSSGGGGGGGGGGYIPKDTVNVYVPEVEEVVVPEEEPSFSDISAHWAKDEISMFVKTGIINGYPDGTFKPDNTITRAEFSVLIYKMLSLSPVFEEQFGDVGESEWYYKYINAVGKEGIVTGYDGIFAPNAPISRQDMAVMVYRMLEINDITEYSYTFKDHSNISDYALDAVYTLEEMDVINGSDGRFEPKNNATRAEAVKILSNALEFMGE